MDNPTSFNTDSLRITSRPQLSDEELRKFFAPVLDDDDDAADDDRQSRTFVNV